ncbi:MAG: hypothetical protein M3O62_14505 [Pseudomonadota bacterium]|nr:hypothetical protein [Pseudomonadota bacterium]
MGIAYQSRIEFLGVRSTLHQVARRADVDHSEISCAERPDRRRLGHLICAASCIFSSWMFWTLGSFVAGQL